MPPSDDAPTDADLIDAHNQDDEAALVRMYTCMADAREAEGDIDAACFFLTQAYVFALHSGHGARAELHARLLAYGREE